jgi:hypothetical protein
MADQERRRAPRFYFISRVDVLIAGSDDPLWGAVANISRTGITLYIQQTLKPRSTATLQFRFQAEGGQEIIEDVNATLVWQRGETVGMEFETPLLAGSPAAQKSSNLEAYIAKKEATDGK